MTLRPTCGHVSCANKTRRIANFQRDYWSLYQQHQDHGRVSPWTLSRPYPSPRGAEASWWVVDRYSKYATFIAAPTDCKADEAARLFVKHIIKLWGVPKSIVSDRDPRFTGCFWTELFKMLGIDLKFSTSFHPQMDGQIEHINSLLEMYLRHYVSAHQRDWVKLLDVAQFSYNL